MTRLFAIASAAALSLPVPTTAAPEKVKDTRPNVEVVFCLDTTGSMGGLIEGAKQKIWSISNQIVAGKPTPNLKVGLLAYRDRGDVYITKLTELTDDLDRIYANIKEYKAEGGGDTPESVNQALNEAVTKFKWSDDKETLRIIFLVGDAPPHMDYKDDVKYPETCKLAVEKGIVINAVQCGADPECTKVWREISDKAGGGFVQIAQDGATVRVLTPYDKRLADINAELENSTLVYGSKEKQREVQDFRMKALDGAKPVAPKSGDPKDGPGVKVEAPKEPTAKPGTVVPTTGGGFGGGGPGAPPGPGGAAGAGAATAPALAADRAVFNASRGLINSYDLLSDIKAGKVKLESLKDEDLPEELRKLSKEKRQAYLDELDKKRDKLREEARDLAKKRDEFTKKKLEEEGKKAKEGFDQKVEELLKKQAKKAGIDY
ncbi:MAG TPA: vWA domain-containing protein [Gemmataceae bacterium]|nr:vWA domain-containing protein [Gemmataceae bacterium]